jgi:GT2 family glycosyltransferase
MQIVSATRQSGRRFMAEAPLALSLKRLRGDSRIKSRIFADNQAGLSSIYNQIIDSDDGPDVQVFMHDDVWIADTFFGDRVLDGLQHFDIIGVAGSARRLPRQVTWSNDPRTGHMDKPYLSGTVAHGAPFGSIASYGPAPLPCKALDGVFLAARRSVLRKAGVRFDPQFAFHFYDLDFCRTAEENGLRLGTWPVVLTHASGGNYDSPSWRAGAAAYLAKWGG